MRLRQLLVILILCLSGSIFALENFRKPVKEINQEVKVSQGLIVAPGAELVRGHCSVCHDLSIVTAQRGDREYWLKTIRWMQRTQNLWALPPAQEETILDYLSEHYTESEWGRRPNLGPLLLPTVSSGRGSTVR